VVGLRWILQLYGLLCIVLYCRFMDFTAFTLKSMGYLAVKELWYVVDRRLQLLYDDNGSINMVNVAKCIGEVHLFVVHIVSEAVVVDDDIDNNLEYAIVEVNAELGHGGLSKVVLGDEGLGGEGGGLNKGDLGGRGENEDDLGGENQPSLGGEDEAELGLGGEAEADLGGTCADEADLGGVGEDKAGNGGEADLGGAAVRMSWMVQQVRLTWVVQVGMECLKMRWILRQRFTIGMNRILKMRNLLIFL